MLVKQFLRLPGEALRAPEDSGSQNSRQLPHDGVKVVNPTSASFTPEEIFRVLISLEC